ncbi:MAG: endonuclease III [candidate division KSB1 bacterium]|nr:endonuclease III [candidate division KSB1 bacterium]
MTDDITIRTNVVRAIDALETQFGVPKYKGRGNPLDSLIKTILSQSTNDRNRDTAYDRLKQRFPAWKDVMNAPRSEVVDAIRPAGLSNQKSERIQDVLKWIEGKYGSLNIDVICDQNPDEVIETLLPLKGIGIKTISVVLMFTCGVDIFPVDTHVHRLCRRLEFVPPRASAEKTYYQMQPLVPEGRSYSFHMNLLKLGRSICRARRPRCAECPLQAFCPSAFSFES